MIRALINLLIALACIAALIELSGGNWYWVLPAAPAVLVLFFLMFAWTIHRSLLDGEITVAGEEHLLDADLLDLLDEYHQLGFELVGPGYQMQSKTPVVVVALVHRQARAYGVISSVSPQNAPQVVDHEIASHLANDGSLTTLKTAAGQIFPERVGKFAQVLEDAKPRVLFEQHCSALRWLESQGVRVEPVKCENLYESLRANIADLRDRYRREWPRYLAVAVWRIATKRCPYMGPLAQQPGAEQAVRRFMTR